jgi:hypothetical protein
LIFYAILKAYCSGIESTSHVKVSSGDILAIRRVLTQGSRKKIVYLLIILVCLVVLDGVLTEYLIDGGDASEANPFLETLVGEPAFMILKVAGALFCAFVLFDIHRRFPRTAMVTTWVAVVGYFGIVVWNTSLIFLA